MSEAANPEGADARSPEERAARILRDFEDERHCFRLVDWLAIEIREAERSAESRGAKARDAEWRESIERALGVEADTENHTPGWAEGLMRRIREIGNARSPSGSPSVPAAQPKDQANHMAAAQAVELRGERPAWAQLVDGALALLEPAERRARQVSQTVVGPSVVQIGASTLLVAVDSLRDALSRAQPRAAPSPALPREAPEPGGTLTADERRRLTDAAAAIVLAMEEEVQDEESFSLGSMLFELASRIRALSEPPRAAPSDSAPATPGLGPPSTGTVRVGVALLVADRQGRILFGQRGKNPNRGLWVLPGGGIHFGEHWREAGERELREETGLSVEINEAVAPVFVEVLGDNEHRIVLTAPARVVGGTLRAGSDLLDAAFFGHDERPPLSPVAKEMLARFGLASGEPRVAPSSPESPAVAADAPPQEESPHDGPAIEGVRGDREAGGCEAGMAGVRGGPNVRAQRREDGRPEDHPEGRDSAPREVAAVAADAGDRNHE